MKHCVKCDKSKSLDCFHKDSRRHDGLFPYCKVCRKHPLKPRKLRSVVEVLSNHIVSDSGCWEWQGVLNIDGYGMACYQGKRVRAHRLSLLTSLGIKETNDLALHHCDNRKCINPDHLYLGTNKDNSMDMVNRGRGVSPKGQYSGQSKLTENQAKAIYLDDRPHKIIALDYRISVSAVSSIKTGRNWKHVTET